MIKLHNIINKDILVPEEGQCDLLCSNKKSIHCPSLGYIQSEKENEVGINKAFDIIFEEVLNNKKQKNEANKINSNICQSIDIKSGK